jgi:omega-6 fatty acid desaturase (delta-12 desaturase)
MKTFGDVQKSVPRDLLELSPFRAWWTVIRIFALLGACLYLETLTDKALYLIPLWFFHGQILVGLFVLGHDCGHRSFSRNRMMNLVMGHVAFSPLGNGLVNWTVTHNHHHAHTQLRGQDVDWSKWLMTEDEFAQASWKNNFAGKFGYALPFGVFFWVWLNAIMRGLRNTSSSVRVSNLIMWSVMISIYGFLAYFTGLSGMFKYHGIPAAIAMFTGYFLLTIQHANEVTSWYSEKSWTPLKGQTESTFDVRFPRIFEWLWLDINIHVPHHISPGIPWYNLRQASAEIKRVHPEIYRERNFSLKEFSWMVRTPFLKTDGVDYFLES